MENISKITLLVIFAFGFINSVANHGKPRDNYNGWTSLKSMILLITLLYFGGYFNSL